MDDEFAKGVGPGFDTLEGLRESVLENLVSNADREADQELYDKAMEQVIEGATVEFAEVLLDRQLDHIWQEREQALQSQQMEMDAYLQQVGKTEEEIREEMRPGTREGLVRSLILRKLAEEEGIEVTEEEVAEHIRPAGGRLGRQRRPIRTEGGAGARVQGLDRIKFEDKEDI